MYEIIFQELNISNRKRFKIIFKYNIKQLNGKPKKLQ